LQVPHPPPRQPKTTFAPERRIADKAGPSARQTTASPSAFDAFLQEYRYCGDLDSAVEGDRVWMTCTCGAAINRSADDDWPRGPASRARHRAGARRGVRL